mmetsp:Transcript_110349/g.154891  ORF Transcript_110349/g.154891 Transcript_110349/m.154891 type:complete len:371 (-) Transcript_110349:236-1348(-)
MHVPPSVMSHLWLLLCLATEIDAGCGIQQSCGLCQAMDAETPELSFLQSSLKLAAVGPRGNLSKAAPASGHSIGPQAKADELLQIIPNTEEPMAGTLREKLVPVAAVLVFPLAVVFLLLTTQHLPVGFYQGGESNASRMLQSVRLPIPQARMASAPVASPVCGSMLLPNSEAVLNGSLTAIRTSKRAVINGSAGRPLLLAAFGVSKARRPMLRVAYQSCETDPRCSVEVVDAETPRFFIYGRKDVLYGSMEPSPAKGQKKCLIIKHKDLSILRLEVASVENVEVEATNPHDGRRLATAGLHAQNDQWQLQAEPGADALLIISCILAVVRLWPSATAEQTRLSGLDEGSEADQRPTTTEELKSSPMAPTAS